MNRIFMYVLLSIMLVTIGTAYSMYLDTVKVNVYVNVAYPDMDIESYRGCLCCHDCCQCCCCHGLEDDQYNLSSDNGTLEVYNISCGCGCHNCCCHNCTVNATLWIGLVIKNNGELPTKISTFMINVSGNYTSYTVEYYLYGPYKTGPLYPWGAIKCSNLPYSGYNNTLVIDKDTKIVAWIKIVIYGIQTVDKISITPVYTPWNT